MSDATPRDEMSRARSRIELTGTVQGVGFRPFVYRLARELQLAGWVRNSRSGLEIEAEGEPTAVEQLFDRLQREHPRHASVWSATRREVPITCAEDFHIETSADRRGANVDILPDLATCPECLAEIFNPADRRYRYPFTNCLQCGPRFSIVLDLPWDRCNTTMRDFTMCPACSAEYGAPDDRRFHAQPNACPECGPQLGWLDATGSPLATRGDALEMAASAIEAGEIVAIKGIGGVHLFADARNAEAVSRLRARKHRPAKPFAVMMPTLEVARGELEIDDDEANHLASDAAPIVILRRRENSRLPTDLAPGNPDLGILLPYSPLHHLLMRRLGFPVVATSGNRGGEPICIDNQEAVDRLVGIADGFLVHDRPIARPVDDSVLRLAAGEPMLLRRSRGFAPAPVSVPDLTVPVLACGGDLKNTVALADRGRVRLSQHFGDLATLESQRAFADHLQEFPRRCGVAPHAVACDLHPAYHSRRQAEGQDLPRVEVQHHHAHAAACAAEAGIGPDEEFFAVVWDGTGAGPDGTIWGGEFLVCRGAEFRRFAWLQPFRLPGGDKAIHDPRFAALGCLHRAQIPVEETFLVESLDAEAIRIGQALLEKGLRSPETSSAGRLFDAVAALCGLCTNNEFEGQAAMALEFAASQDPDLTPYPVDEIAIEEGSPIDWTPLLRAVVADLAQGRATAPQVSRRFHLALAELIARTASQAAKPIVALSGGCFQNRLLLQLALDRLRATGRRVVRHRLVPPNDGGLAFGQAVVASRRRSAHTA